eukprot:3008374-Rhodomonas_salina.1
MSFASARKHPPPLSSSSSSSSSALRKPPLVAPAEALTPRSVNSGASGREAERPHGTGSCRRRAWPESSGSASSSWLHNGGESKENNTPSCSAVKDREMYKTTTSMDASERSTTAALCEEPPSTQTSAHFNENIKVVIRVKPVPEDRAWMQCVSTPVLAGAGAEGEEEGKTICVNSQRHKDDEGQQFEFDAVCGAKSGEEEVWRRCAREL